MNKPVSLPMELIQYIFSFLPSNYEDRIKCFEEIRRVRPYEEDFLLEGRQCRSCGKTMLIKRETRHNGGGYYWYSLRRWRDFLVPPPRVAYLLEWDLAGYYPYCPCGQYLGTRQKEDAWLSDSTPDDWVTNTNPNNSIPDEYLNDSTPE